MGQTEFADFAEARTFSNKRHRRLGLTKLEPHPDSMEHRGIVHELMYQNWWRS